MLVKVLEVFLINKRQKKFDVLIRTFLANIIIVIT